MNVPHNLNIPAKDWVNIQAKIIWNINKYGAKAVEKFLDSIPLQMRTSEGKLLGAYIENKVREEFRITHYELYESNERQNVTEARQVLCVLIEKYMQIDKTEISLMFNKSRHFAKRLILPFKQKLKENHAFDRKLIERYKRLDGLIGAYVAFKPNTKA